MRRTVLLALFAALALLPATGAFGYGLFTCYDPAGREVGVVDSGTRTGFVPADLCNAACPACAGRCTAARRFPERSGRWVETWREPAGISDNNRLVPGPDAGEDARTIVREGLAAPAQEPGPALPPPGRGQ